MLKLHPRSVNCFGRPPTRAGVRKGPTSRRHVLFGAQAGGSRAETDEDHQANVFAQQPLDGTSTPLPWERCSSGSGRRSGRLGPGASATGDSKKAEDREHAEGHATGSPEKPASAGLTESALTANRTGCSRVRPSGAPAHRHRGKQRSKQDERQPSKVESPRKHRAMRRRKRQHIVTDLTVDQSPEVERSITADQSGTLRSRKGPGRRARIVNNGERARTAVTRARRLQCPAREGITRFAWRLPNEPRRRREARMTRHRLPAREKLRRVERQWERPRDCQKSRSPPRNDRHLLGGDGRTETAKSKPNPSGPGKDQAEELRTAQSIRGKGHGRCRRS